MQITVIGSSEKENKKALLEAREVGQILAKKNITLVCGGLTGVMLEASRGAFEAAGDVLGVLPTLDPSDANPFVTHVVATGQSHGRNLAVVASGNAVIAISGHWGTLSEIAFARKLGLAVVCLGDWRIDFPEKQDSGLLFASDAKEAVRLAEENALIRQRSIAKTESVDDKLDA